MNSRDYAAQIATEIGVRASQVASAAALFGEGNTIPFVARYRKERTGSLDEEQLRVIAQRLDYMTKLDERRDTVTTSISEQGKLTDEVKTKLEAATSLQELEDLYLPYKPKRRTRATVARERGLEPLADLLQNGSQRSGSPEQYAAKYVSDDVPTPEDALAGARDIVAEGIAEDAEARAVVRRRVLAQGHIGSKEKKNAEDPTGKYRDYYDYGQPLATIPPHRVLALNRGEKEGVLSVATDPDSSDAIVQWLQDRATKHPRSIFAPQLAMAAEDGYSRLLFPAIERDVRGSLTETAEAHAIRVFGANLRALLLQPPIHGQRILGIDPGFRTGSKITAIDETGKLLATATIYPHPPQKHWAEAKAQVSRIIAQHAITLVAIGNGTASRETESFVAELIAEGANVSYVMVSEAGASVYSASRLAADELPDLDVSMRGAVSIARRLQDPLAELVKVEPRSIGVGLYQHDVDQKALTEALEAVVESAVNHVGVNVNTASPALLQHVSGLSARVAKAVVAHRDAHGAFAERGQLLDVKGLGARTYEQAVGFLKIPGGKHPLDNTFIHPESYDACLRLLRLLGLDDTAEPDDVRTSWAELLARGETPKSIAAKLGIGVPTLQDMIDNLLKPGLDPRDELPKPILRQDILKLEDLTEGMILQGTVRNVVDFGAFVDIGVKQDGLVHISQLSNTYVRDPLDVVSVGDIVTVRVLGVDTERGRISLTMRD